MKYLFKLMKPLLALDGAGPEAPLLWWVKSVDLAGSEGRFEMHIKQAASKNGLLDKVTQRPH